MVLIILSSTQDINKRLSLPADLRVPDAFLEKQSISPEVPLSRASRRQSLSEIGFGRMETYTKLDKLGEVRVLVWLIKEHLYQFCVIIAFLIGIFNWLPFLEFFLLFSRFPLPCTCLMTNSFYCRAKVYFASHFVINRFIVV